MTGFFISLGGELFL